MTEPSTPLMRQYAAIKKEHPNALLFFRLGDFYELFFEDAVVAARELQITLTSRNKEKGIAIPMCGVPYHAAENYIAKLIRNGFKVAICEQMEDPRMAKKLVQARGHAGADAGHGSGFAPGRGGEQFPGVRSASRQMRAGIRSARSLHRRISRHRISGRRRARGGCAKNCWVLRPREVLFASSLPLFDQTAQQSAERRGQPRRAWRRWKTPRWAETPLEDWVFAPDYAIPQVENHFGVLSLEGFGLAGRPAAAARPAPSCTTSAPRSAARSTTWTASAFTSGRTAWCWMRSRCATWS